MNKLAKMRLCDWMLMVLTVLTLASSIQLEATGSRGVMWVVLHIIVATAFIVLIGWHLYLHFQWRNWFKLLWKQKSPVTRWMSVFGLLTVVTAVIAVVEWLHTFSHAVIGGVHGKLGFIFLALAIGHTIKRIKSPVLKKPKVTKRG